MPAAPTQQEALATIAGHGVLPSRLQPIEVPADLWADMRYDIGQNRLSGLAISASNDGRLVLAEAAAAELAALDAQWARRTLQAEDMLLEAHGSIADAGIETRVLKGPALAELAWSIPEARRWVDADLLVRSVELEQAVRVLERLGYERRLTEVRPGFDRRFQKGVTMRSLSGEVDLHRTLASPPFSLLIDETDLWDDPRSFAVEGIELATVSATVAFLHACIHAAVGGAQRLVQLRDVLETFRVVDQELAASLVDRWRMRAVVASAAESAKSRLMIDDHPFLIWAEPIAQAVERQDRLLVEAWDRADRRGLALASLRLIRRPSDKARFVLWRLWPSKTNRRSRGMSVSSSLHRLTRRW